MRKWIHRGIWAATLSSALVGVEVMPALAATGVTTLSGSPAQHDRLAGSSREATAVAVAQAEYPNGVPSATAIVSSGGASSLIDTLVAGPLAYALHDPVLLAQNRNTLGPTTQKALSTLGIQHLILVGAMASGNLVNNPPPNTTISGTYGTAFNLQNQDSGDGNGPGNNNELNGITNWVSGSTGSVTVSAPANLSVTGLSATISQNGTTVQTISLPMGDYDASSGSVTFTAPAGLAAGTYSATVTLNSSNQTYTSSTTAFSVGSNLSGTVTVSAPANLTVTGLTATFSQNGNTVQTVSLPTGDYNASSGNVTFTPPAGLAAGTYTVTVSLADSTQTYTSSSASFSVGSNLSGSVAVSAPTNLTVTGLTATLSQNGNTVQTVSLPTEDYDSASGSITFTPPAGLAAGTYTVSMSLATSNGTYHSNPSSFTVGTNPVTVTAPSNLTVTGLTVTFDQNGSTVQTISLPTGDYDSASGSITFTPPTTLASGAYDVSASLQTPNGTYISSHTTYLVPANTPGALTVSAPANLAVSGLTATFDQNGNTVQTVSLPTGDYDSASGSITFTPPSGLAAGTYTATVTLNSSSQTYTSSTISFAVGSNPSGSVTVTAPANLTVTGLTATFDQNGNTVQTVSLPTGDYNASTGAIVITPPTSLAAGDYSVSVTLTVADHTTTSASTTITVGSNPGSAVTGGTAAEVTAAQVAQALLSATGQSSFSTVVLASEDPANVVDALSIGPVAARLGAPILLVPRPKNGQTTVPPVEAGFIQNATKVIQVGSLSQASVTNLPGSATVQRLGGATRFQTSLAIDSAYFAHPSTIYLANGQSGHLIDAATATPLAASQNAPILLVNNGLLQPSDLSYLQTLSQLTGVKFVILGGTASIPKGIWNQFPNDKGNADRGQNPPEKPGHGHPGPKGDHGHSGPDGGHGN